MKTNPQTNFSEKENAVAAIISFKLVTPFFIVTIIKITLDTISFKEINQSKNY